MDTSTTKKQLQTEIASKKYQIEQHVAQIDKLIAERDVLKAREGDLLTQVKALADNIVVINLNTNSYKQGLLDSIRVIIDEVNKNA